MSALKLVRSPLAEYEAQESKTEIPKSLSPRVRTIHLRGLSNVKMMNEGEQNLLEDLREMDDTRGFAEFRAQSLYAYAVDWLKLTPAVALNLIAIMRKAKEVPELVKAIKEGRINISAARKITPVINGANKEAWLELASTSSVAVVEKAVATASPKHAVQESIRYVTGERLELKLGVGEEFHDLLKELKDVLSQKNQKPIDSEDALLIAMRETIARNSPLEKAKRSRLRRERSAIEKLTKENANAKAKASGVSNADSTFSVAADGVSTKDRSREESVFKRTHLSSATKHFVILRDGNRCTEIDGRGVRCTQTRWLDTHHIIEVSKGGDNSPENLRTICAPHHRQHHSKQSYVM